MTDEAAKTDKSRATKSTPAAEVSDVVAQASIKANDRVRRKKREGCFGTVQDVREEVTATSLDANECGLLVSVLWDNGTFSYFTPDALEVV